MITVLHFTITTCPRLVELIPILARGTGSYRATPTPHWSHPFTAFRSPTYKFGRRIPGCRRQREMQVSDGCLRFVLRRTQWCWERTIAASLICCNSVGIGAAEHTWRSSPSPWPPPLPVGKRGGT